MDFFNDTPFPATFFRTGLLYKDLIMATTVVKCSFKVKDGVVSPASEQLAIVEEDAETEVGHLDGDISLIKRGCDFAVMGNAVAGPEGVKTERMTVDISLHKVHQHLVVIGDRFWVKRRGNFEISSPEFFEKMPLDYRHAFGGQTTFFDQEFGTEIDIMSPLNPQGKGYVEQPNYVEGTQLPNIEDPNHPIVAWTDRPNPIGCAPLPRNLPLRGMRGMHVDLDAERTTLDSSAFLFCHPDMHLDSYPEGKQIVISGMTEGGTWSTVLPEVAFTLSVQLGDNKYTVPLVPDTLVVLPSYNRFFVVARQALVYQFVPERTRTARLSFKSDNPESGRITTIADERKAVDSPVPIEPENPKVMPLPFDELLEHYPLTTIIESLPLLISG